MDNVLASGSRLLQSTGIRVPEVDPPIVIESILERALAALGGNRTPETPTRLERGELQPLIVPPTQRAEVKAALYSVRFGGYTESRRRLGILIDRHPDWPLPRFYRAELLMWVGLLDDARRDLEDALSMKIRDREIETGQWPGIGLAGVQVLQGLPREALRTIERAKRRFAAPPAQPYFAWHGEILRALGKLDEARDALERVCQPGGHRLGSWITLALTCRDMGDRDRPRRILAYVAEQAPSLMIDVTRTAGKEDIRRVLESPDGLDRLSDKATIELLERALPAMKGNRSASCLTFVDASGRLRTIPPHGFHRLVNPADERRDLRAMIAVMLDE
jgi:tetratricopeptide (TPR) repeat protein